MWAYSSGTKLLSILVVLAMGTAQLTSNHSSTTASTAEVLYSTEIMTLLTT